MYYAYIHNVAGQLPVSRVESVPGFQMRSEEFPALPGTSKSNGEYLHAWFVGTYIHILLSVILQRSQLGMAT